MWGLVAAMSGKADCFKILPRKNRATKAWNPHSASIMQRAKSWEVLPCAWHDYVRVGLCTGGKGKEWEVLPCPRQVFLHLMHWCRGIVQINALEIEVWKAFFSHVTLIPVGLGPTCSRLLRAVHLRSIILDVHRSPRVRDRLDFKGCMNAHFIM